LFGRGCLLAGLGGGARVIRAPSGRPLLLLGMFLGRIFGLGIFWGQMGAGSRNTALEFWGPGWEFCTCSCCWPFFLTVVSIWFAATSANVSIHPRRATFWDCPANLHLTSTPNLLVVSLPPSTTGGKKPPKMSHTFLSLFVGINLVR